MVYNFPVDRSVDPATLFASDGCERIENARILAVLPLRSGTRFVRVNCNLRITLGFVVDPLSVSIGFAGFRGFRSRFRASRHGISAFIVPFHCSPLAAAC